MTIKVMYFMYLQFVCQKLTDEERAAIPMEFKCSLYDDLIIQVADVFYRVK